MFYEHRLGAERFSSSVSTVFAKLRLAALKTNLFLIFVVVCHLSSCVGNPCCAPSGGKNTAVMHFSILFYLFFLYF